MIFLNLISLVGILGLCAIAWLFSERRDPKYFPWKTVIVGLMLQALLGALVFVLPETQTLFRTIGSGINLLFEAADAGARFIFGKNLVPLPGQEPLILTPLATDATSCTADSVGQVIPGFCAIGIGYVYAFRALPGVIFLTGLASLLYWAGMIQALIHLLARVGYRLMRLSGAECLSGMANLFVSIEAVILIKPYLARMTRSQLCTVLACCFGTAASSAIPSYTSILRPVFPNVVAHLTAASLMAIPACFLLSKIIVPEARIPLPVWDEARGSIDHLTLSPSAELPTETRTEPEIEEIAERANPIEAAITGAIAGIKIAASIVAVLILTLGSVYLLYQLMRLVNLFSALPAPVGRWFQLLTPSNLLGALFLPLTVLTGISLNWEELWQSSVLLGRRLLETAILPYQSLSAAASIVEPARIINDRAVLILTYGLSGFAHLAFWGIVVGGAIALLPTRRRELINLSWRALLAGTLATFMTASFVGFYDGLFGTNATRTMGKPDAPPPAAPQSQMPHPLPLAMLPSIAPPIGAAVMPQSPDIPVG